MLVSQAMRIVRVCVEVEGIGPDSLNHILWKPPPPLPVPYMCGSDVLALYELQKESFAPASSLHIEPANGPLVGVKVFSQLGLHAGINGIQFMYGTGPGTLWGYSDDSASLSFFLDKTERITEVTVYRTGSKVYHVQVSLHACYLPYLGVR